MIIVSIVGPTMKEALAQVTASRRYADMVEFRLDLMESPDLVGLLSSARVPTVVSCRSGKEGGKFGGREKERRMLLELAGAFGADYIDLECQTDQSLVKKLRHRSKVILSIHLPKPPRGEVSSLFEKMRNPGGDVLKLAYKAEDAAEIRSAREFLELCRRRNQNGVAIAMGVAGEASRILYRKFGGWATYASAEEGAPAAEGQLSAKVLKKIYRADRLTGETEVFGVIGYPLGQSKGTLLHNPLFDRAGKNAVYCRFPTRNLRAFMETIGPLLSGFSVTIPHKRDIIKYLDSVDEDAAGSGAVNTVLRRGTRLWGTNTDGTGALDAIEHVRKVKGMKMLVLGAGGAARAIVYEAKQRGVDVAIVNRTESKAKALAKELGASSFPMKKLSRIQFDILVNATPVGMVPKINASPVQGKILRGKIVFDVVFNPAETKLLRDAKKAGAVTISGIEMYLNQALRQAELYTGVKASRRFALRQLMGG